jgi:hypothetical protein
MATAGLCCILGRVIDNPFAVLTAVVAPAILTNACSVLAMSTSNRVGRVVDRTRAVVAELVGLQPDSDAHGRRQRQLALLRRRSRLLVVALRTVYAALGAFAACAMISVIGDVADVYDVRLLFRVAAVTALAAGCGAVLALVVASAVMVGETTLALRSVDADVDDALVRRPI